MSETNLLPDKWFAILPDNSLKEILIPKSKIRCSYLVRRIDTGKRNTTSFGFTHTLFEYEIYDSNNEKMIIDNIGWEIIKLFDPHNKNTYNGEVRAQIIDPLGVSRVHLSKSDHIEGVIEILNDLKKISKYDNWETYDIFTENESLKEIKMKFQEEITLLQQKIESFEKTPFFEEIQTDYKAIGIDEGLDNNQSADLINKFKITDVFIKHWLAI